MPVIKCYAFGATYFAHTPHGNSTILTSEIAHLQNETGSGGESYPRTPPLARACPFHEMFVSLFALIRMELLIRKYRITNIWLQNFLSINVIEIIDIMIASGNVEIGYTKEI